MSPTLSGSPACRVAPLERKMSWLNVTVWPVSTSAPPSANRPFGVPVLTWLSSRELSLMVRSPTRCAIPPPSASLVRSDSSEAFPTLLWLTEVRTTVRSPQLLIPPPITRANWHGPAGQALPVGTVAAGATRFPVIALSVIVTVAPGPKSGPGGTSIPPPEANAPVTTVNLAANGLVRDTPPVMVTPDMETVGRAASPNVPIVSTGPPPRITVVPLPDPARVTLVVIVSPPVYTPGPILILSP